MKTKNLVIEFLDGTVDVYAFEYKDGCSNVLWAHDCILIYPKGEEEDHLEWVKIPLRNTKKISFSIQ